VQGYVESNQKEEPKETLEETRINEAELGSIPFSMRLTEQSQLTSTTRKYKEGRGDSSCKKIIKGKIV